MFSLFLSLLFTVFIKIRANELVPAFNRMVQTYTDLESPTNNVASILDAGRQKAINSTLYTLSEATQLTKTAFQYFLTQFGLNATAGVYVAAFDGWILPNAQIIPVGIGLDMSRKVTIDTDHLLRGASEKWFVASFGNFVLMTSNGVFTGGAIAGQSYAAGDILVYVEAYFLKEKTHPNAWQLPFNKEFFISKSILPSKQVTSSEGVTWQLGRSELWIESNGIGTEFVSIMPTRVNSTTIRQIGITTYFWV